MALFEHFYLHAFFVFTLVLARISTLLMTTPIFGTADIPARVRGFLAVALALIITPTQLAAPFTAPTTLVDYGIMIASDLLVGLVIGLGLMILFSGIQVAGQVISQMAGISLADVFNPGFDSEIPVYSQFLYYVTLAVFVLIGGHRKVLDALLGTFATVPPGRAALADSLVQTIIALLTESFVLGIRSAAPAMVALLLATLVLGLISRALPQINVMSIGFGLNSLITFAALIVSMSAIAWLFQNQLEPSLETILEGIQQRPG